MPYFDTMIAAYLLDSSSRRYRLSDVASKNLDYTMSEYADMVGKGKDQITFDYVAVAKATQYSAEDAEISFSLKHILEEELKKEGLLDLFYNIEMPLLFVLQGMEKNGVRIDVDHLKKLSSEYALRMMDLEKEIFGLAGELFNINSPKQLQAILFEKLQLPMKKKTKTGASTDISVLEELSSEHELPKKIVEYRQYQKLKSTYIDALPLLIKSQTGRVHTSFNQTIAATGRLSSTEPNLQNIPIRTDMGKEIRKAFIADEGNVLISADYSQIELRIFASIAGDENMIEAFRQGKDIHTSTASNIFNIPLEQVTSDQRRYAKTINFGLMYGMGPFRLSKELNISMDEAKKFIENYFNSYPKIKECIDKILAEAMTTGYVKTLFGRKRYIPALMNANRNLQEAGKREAVNTVIQGTAADIIKVAMIRIDQQLTRRVVGDPSGRSSKMILQIHDELVFDVPEGEVEEIKKIMTREMEGVIELAVPLKIDIGIGKNWLEAH